MACSLRSNLGGIDPDKLYRATLSFLFLLQGLKGDVTRDDLQERFLAQHSVAMLEQCCNHSKQCPDNVATMFCESYRATSPKHQFFSFFLMKCTLKNVYLLEYSLGLS